MTGDKTQFVSLTYKEGAKILGYGIVVLSRTKVENVCLVEGLKQNLLSISQLVTIFFL